MNKDIKEIRVSIDITAMYGSLHIAMKNTHNGKLLYNVSEKIKNVWEKVSYSASEYILEDFKKTPEHKEMLDILNVATKDYGY